LTEQLIRKGILPLEARDITLVQSQLFGWQSILAEFEGAEEARITICETASTEE